jgi:hypothetical protein
MQYRSNLDMWCCDWIDDSELDSRQLTVFISFALSSVLSLLTIITKDETPSIGPRQYHIISRLNQQSEDHQISATHVDAAQDLARPSSKHYRSTDATTEGNSDLLR